MNRRQLIGGAIGTGLANLLAPKWLNWLKFRPSVEQVMSSLRVQEYRTRTHPEIVGLKFTSELLGAQVGFLLPARRFESIKEAAFTKELFRRTAAEHMLATPEMWRKP